MPLTARCKECGYILYSGDFSLRSGMREGIHYSYSFPNVPQKIINLHEGKCPKCERELEMPTWKDLEILPDPEHDFPWRRERQGKRKEVKVDSV